MILAGKTILVTGSGGFIGKHLCRRLALEGAEVHTLVRSPAGGGREHVLQGQGSEAVEHIERVLRDTGSSVVIHLASLFLAAHTHADIDRLAESNLLFGMRLLEAMDRAGTRRLINTGTYWQHFEDRPYDPVNLYAATKQAFADILAYYVNARAFSAITLELYDTYGPGDTRPKLLALLEKTAQSGAHLGMSPGAQKLDLVHVDDVCTAYVKAAERLLAGTAGHEVYAVSSGNPMPLKDVVALFERVTGRKLDIGWGEREYRPREVMVPWKSGKTLPGFAPAVSLEEGFRKYHESAVNP